MKYIVSDPKILSGTPVINGTRVPVSRVMFLLKQGYTLEDINKEYDHISITILEHVIDELTYLVGKTIPSKITHESQVS